MTSLLITGVQAVPELISKDHPLKENMCTSSPEVRIRPIKTSKLWLEGVGAEYFRVALNSLHALDPEDFSMVGMEPQALVNPRAQRSA